MWGIGLKAFQFYQILRVSLDSRLDIGKQIFGAKKVSGIILSFCVPLVFKATVVTKEVFGFVNNANLP